MPRFPVFTKRVSALRAHEVIEALDSLQVDYPANIRSNAAKKLLTEYLHDNPELMDDPDHQQLFTKAQRKAWDEKQSAIHDKDTSLSGESSDEENDDGPAASHGENLDPTTLAHLRLLQAMSPEQIQTLIASASPNDPPPARTYTQTAVEAALAAKQRPARRAGAVATDTGYPAPELVRRRIASGWTSHIPYTTLTDDFCSPTNAENVRKLEDTLGIDRGSATIVRVDVPLDATGEEALTIEEWDQSDARMAGLIRIYVAQEAEAWGKHSAFVRTYPNRKRFWGILIRYDIGVRKRALISDLDPSVLQQDIWDEAALAYTTGQAISTAARVAQAEAAKFAPASASSIGGAVRTESSRPRQQAHPYPRAARGSKAPKGSFRCFVCGSEEADHASRTCNASRLVSGGAVVLISRPGEEGRTDSKGRSYCFSWNGRRGCSGGRSCSRGNHWCTLCGSQDGAHTAQNCPHF